MGETSKHKRVSNRSTKSSHHGDGGDQTAHRNIEPQQNWLARLFRVKPATRHLCFSVSRRRARQETATLLKEWRKYGMYDVEVDKDRNIVFARLGQPNCKLKAPLTTHSSLPSTPPPRVPVSMA